jgi:hypothetical protein
MLLFGLIFYFHKFSLILYFLRSRNKWEEYWRLITVKKG